MCSDYTRYVSKKNSSAIDVIGKELKGEGRNKKEYYHARLKEGYYFSCTSENLPMNERNEIYVSNFVEFKKMLRSITLLESAAKAEKKLRDAAKRREKRLQKMIEEDDSIKIPSKKIKITKKDREGLKENESVGIISGRFGTEKVIFIGDEIEIDISD